MSFDSGPVPLNEAGNSGADKTGSATTVLLADDEEMFREMISEVLRRAGYLVLQAATSESALEAAKQAEGKVVLLVSDVQLPEKGGIRLFEELRRSNPDLKVVFISGYSREQVSAETPLPGGAAFLEKPFEFKTLLAAMQQVLR